MVASVPSLRSSSSPTAAPTPASSTTACARAARRPGSVLVIDEAGMVDAPGSSPASSATPRTAAPRWSCWTTRRSSRRFGAGDAYRGLL